MFGGKVMDSFMDKIAQKFGTTDVIKANSEAEARELQAAKEKISEYEKLLSEMRRLNLKCVETNEMTNQLVQSSVERLDAYKAQGAGKDYSEELEAIKAALEENSAAIKAEEDFIHKENVRVYRNVQASIIDELKQQTEAIDTNVKNAVKGFKGTKAVAIVSLVLNALIVLAIAGQVVIHFLGITF